MKKMVYALTVMGFALMVACKGKPDDAALQTKVSETVKVPGVSSEVKEGVVTLSGTVTDEASKASAESAAKGVEGIKSVTNNIMVAAPAPVVETPAPVISPDADLASKVTDATKDFPGVSATVADGVISVKGELSKEKWRTLKMSLDGLGPKKVDASGLKIKG